MKRPCQVCGLPLTPRRDGLAKRHGPGGDCPGAGYRLERWPVGQHLRHHAGSVWEVIDDDAGRTRDWSPDYLIRCVVGTTRPGSRYGEPKGREMVAHGEYMHRHGWTPIPAPVREGGEQ